MCDRPAAGHLDSESASELDLAGLIRAGDKEARSSETKVQSLNSLDHAPSQAYG